MGASSEKDRLRNSNRPLMISVDGIDPDTSVFTEPTACAMHGVETLSPRPGSTALVFGAGPTGLLLSQLIGRGGAVRVTVAARSAWAAQSPPYPASSLSSSRTTSRSAAIPWK